MKSRNCTFPNRMKKFTATVVEPLNYTEIGNFSFLRGGEMDQQFTKITLYFDYRLEFAIFKMCCVVE